MTSRREQNPTALDSGVQAFPFGELSPFDFEVLVRFLLQHELQHQNLHRFTSVAQMPGVGDRGRDFTLFRDGVICGAVQCKKLKARFTKRMLIRELVKFSMHALLDPSLIPDRDDFTYHFYLAGELTESATLLVHGYPIGIDAEIENGSIAQAVGAHIGDHQAFRHFLDAYDVNEVAALLRGLSVSVFTQCELARRLQDAPHLISTFFRVQTVIDYAGAQVLLRQALTDCGFGQMSAESRGGSRAHSEREDLEPRVVVVSESIRAKPLGLIARACLRLRRGIARPTPGPCLATIGYGLLRALSCSVNIAALSLSAIFFIAMMNGAMRFGICGMIFLIPLATFAVFMGVSCRDHRRELRRHSRMPSPAAIATIDWGVPSALVIATTLACVICLTP